MSNKPNTISHVVKLKQMMKRWRAKARESSAHHHHDVVLVPPGHVAVCVGPERRRYVVRATHLNHPAIQSLLARAEEEFGFPLVGPIAIPNCDEPTFEDVLRAVSASLSHSHSPRRPGGGDPHRFAPGCHVVGGLVGILHGGHGSGTDSRPLLRG